MCYIDAIEEKCVVLDANGTGRTGYLVKWTLEGNRFFADSWHPAHILKDGPLLQHFESFG